MKIEKYTCDQCGKEKGEINHWYGIRLQLDHPGAVTHSFLIQKWQFTADEDSHVCGQNCASILLARWMATGSLDAPKLD